MSRAGSDEARSAPAPGGIRPEEIALLVTELAPRLDGARIGKIHQRGSDAFQLKTRSPAGPLDLYLSVRRGFTRFHVDVAPAAPSAAPTEKAMALRELLRNGRIRRVTQPGGDRIVRVDVEVVRDEKKHQRTLVLELFGSSGRLLIVEGPQRKVLFVHGRGGIEPGRRYEFPPPPPPRGDGVAFPFDPNRLVPEDRRGEPLAFNEALAHSMATAEAAADARERRDAVTRNIARERRRLEQLLGKLDAQAEQAHRWQESQRNGDLLKASLGQLKRGMEKVTVTDYFDEALPQREIALDPAKTPLENVERYFHRARKGKRSIEHLAERRRLCESDLEALAAAESVLVDSGNDEDGAVATAEGHLRKLKLRSRKPKPRRSPPKQSTRTSGRKSKSEELRELRRFRSREGLDIFSGRSARENDRLTMHIARGNDLFFHIAHRPGPHVILRVPRGKNASPESIADAAFIAAYLSGWRGPGAAIVHWTEVKHIRKPKGSPPGAVLLGREREHRVPYERETLGRLVVDPDSTDAENP